MTVRATRRVGRVVRGAADREADRDADRSRVGAVRQARDEIDGWRRRAIPDAAAPLDPGDLVRLLRDLVATLALEPAIASGTTVNTVRFYRRKDIIDPPAGRTAAARYGVHHLWQVAGARLAGYLGLVTLAEARSAMRGADDATLLAFLAARVADARARDAVRRRGAEVALGDASVPPATVADLRPLPGRRQAARGAASASVTIALPGDAWCVVPATHAALRSPDAARALVRALAGALATD